MSEPVLEVTTPHLSHIRILLRPATTVGREGDPSARLDDPTVSRRHATIEVGGGRMTVHDLDSLNGTYVNGRRIHGSAEIRAGDVVSFGSVNARVVAPGADFRPDVSFQAGQQNAHQINMAGRDQFNYIRAERESFLADISATKTKGRRLVTFGFLCLAAGFCLFGYGVIAFIQAIPDLDPNTPPSAAPSPLGPDIAGGIPLGAVGFALAALGSFTLIAGIVLHVSAAARLRRLQNTNWPQ
ncbi:FHA domain-containing protein [Actinoplanes sp. CA-142083]|uniref:FHA domain-containing protein n=1 Tax=Actinoplanes sp. CA-142083 TaxID=3239903 RepID=UPI003D8C5811